MRNKKSYLMILSVYIILCCLFPVFGLAQNERTFTLEELAKFNGKDGARAYVAVNGKVYDLTGIPQWLGGKHFCPGAIAGKDITSIWNKAPAGHFGSNFLVRFPEVGRLVATPVQPEISSTPTPKPKPTTPAERKNAPIRRAETEQRLRVSPLIWGLVGIGLGLIIWYWLRSRRKKT